MRHSAYIIRWLSGADLVCFITKKVNLFEPFMLNVPQRIGLVPTVREYVE